MNSRPLRGGRLGGYHLVSVFIGVGNAMEPATEYVDKDMKQNVTAGLEIVQLLVSLLLSEVLWR